MNESITNDSEEFKEICESLFPDYDENRDIIREAIFDRGMAQANKEVRQVLIDIAAQAAERCGAKDLFDADLKEFNAAEILSRAGHLEAVQCPKEYEELFNAYKLGEIYIVDNAGTYKIVERKGSDEKYVLKICNHPLFIVKRYRNLVEHTEKVVIAFPIRGAWHTVTAEREMIASNTKILKLANSGIDISSESARDIVRYFQHIMRMNDDIIPIIETIGRLGWHEGEFVPYSSTVKCDAEDNFRDIMNQLTSKGDFEVWRNHCLKLRENIPLRLIMAASFASPLIGLIGGLPFVVHLWGDSGGGKTVALCVAASVWGNGAYINNALIQSFKATEYALGEKAAFLYSLPVLIDEGQTVRDKSEFNSLVMALTEGKSRSQGAASGGIKKLRHWANCFITTAEENIVKLNSGGGTSNRVISISSEDKVIEDGRGTMQVISDNYGFAGQMYINYLKTIPKRDMRALYNAIYRELQEKADSTEKQCAAMAVLLLADTFARRCIFDSEKPLNISDAMPFLTSKKEVDNAERARQWLVDWVAQNVNRFQTGTFGSGEVWGKFEVQDNIAVINRTVLIEHLGRAGFDYGAVMPALAKRGHLKLTSQGKWLHHSSICGVKVGCVKLVLHGVDFEELDDCAPSPWE